MSVLVESEDFMIISHEEYIKKVYKNEKLDGWCANELIFQIHEPFYASNNSILQTHVSDVYKKHLSTIHSFFGTKKVCKEKEEAVGTESLKKNSKRPNQVTLSRMKAYTRPDCNYPITSRFFGGNSSDKSIEVFIEGFAYIIPPRCLFYNKDIFEMEFSEHYDIIVIDPPWWNKAIRRMKKGTRNQGYPMLQNEDIKRIDLHHCLKAQTAVFIWCTNSPSQLATVEDYFHSMGLKRVCTLYWLKVTTSGAPVVPFRNVTSSGKQPYERIAIGMRDSNDMFQKYDGRIIISVPSAIHSHKPPLVEVIERIYNSSIEDLKCLELFARGLLPGWTSVGLEVLKLQNGLLFQHLDPR